MRTIPYEKKYYTGYQILSHICLKAISVFDPKTPVAGSAFYRKPAQKNCGIVANLKH